MDSAVRAACLAAALWLSVSAASAATTIQLSASPSRVPADGLSEITLQAVVRRDGTLVASGLRVLFSTQQGTLSPLGGGQAPGQSLEVEVQSGFAKCLLRATTFEATAIVTAFVVGEPGRVVDQVEVGFGARTGPAAVYDNLIRIRGDYLWYGPEPTFQIMEIIGNAVVTYQGVEVRANRIQLDLQDYLLLARSFQPRGVIVANSPPPYEDQDLENGDQPPYSGEALAMDIRTQTGAVFSAHLGQTIFFSGRALVRQQDRPITPGMFDLFDLEGAKVWIEAKSAAVYPYQKIRFDHARFFVNGAKLFSMPYYFESLGYEARLGPAIMQVINYSSQDGFIVDFPYYFDVGDRHTNEFRLTRGVRTGIFGRTTGFQLSYAHHTDLKGDKGEFDFVFDDMLGRFGVQYHRQQRFGPYTFGTISLDWPRHDNFYTNTTFYTPAGPGNISVTSNIDWLNAFGTFGSGISASSNAVWMSQPVRLSAIDSSLTGSLGLGYSHTIGARDLHRQSASLTLTKNPWQLGRAGSIQPYMGVRFQNTVDGSQEVGYTFNTTYRQQMGRSMAFSLGYTYDTIWNSDFKIPDRQTLTANWNLYTEHLWTGYAYGNWSLNDNSLSLSALLDYAFSRHYGMAGQTLYQTSSFGSFSESEVWLYRTFGARELRLRYSFDESRLFVEVDNSF